MKVTEVTKYENGMFYFNVDVSLPFGVEYSKEVSAEALRCGNYDAELEKQMAKLVSAHIGEVDYLADEDGDELEDFEMIALDFIGDEECEIQQIEVNRLYYELGTRGYYLADEESLKQYKREGSARKYVAGLIELEGIHAAEIYHQE